MNDTDFVLDRPLDTTPDTARCTTPVGGADRPCASAPATVGRVRAHRVPRARGPRVVALLGALLAARVVAPQQVRAETPPAFHLDVEVDPTAYVLNGYSLHVGFGWERWRLDVGAYALDLPRFVHGNDGVDLAFHGYGAKLHYFFLEPQLGPFAGVDVNLASILAERSGSELGERTQQVGIGVHGGWRFELPADFYATPWLGLGWSPGADDLSLGGERVESPRFTVFPALHLGRRFR